MAFTDYKKTIPTSIHQKYKHDVEQEQQTCTHRHTTKIPDGEACIHCGKEFIKGQ